jgi:hypothetical protein
MPTNNKYGVPLPNDVLFEEIGKRYGAAQANELHAILREAQRRYSAVGRLRRFELLTENVYLQNNSRYADRLKLWQSYLANPTEYIDPSPNREK